MKIKTKLNILVLSMVVAITLSLGVNMAFQGFVNEMLREQSELINLRDIMQNQNMILAKLVKNRIPVLTQKKVIEESIKSSNEALDRVLELKIIPSLNDKTKSSFEIINNLKSLLESSYIDISKALEHLVSLIERNAKTFVVSRVEIYSTSPNYDSLVEATIRVVGTSSRAEITIDAAIDILSEQTDVINRVIKNYRSLAFIISLSVAVIASILGALLGYMFSKNISRSISVLAKSLSIMATGDFTHKIIVKSSDELGTLGKEMNDFQDDLNKSLSRIKVAAHQNEDTKIGLLETTADSSAVTTEISANISSIDKQMRKLDINISNTNSETKDISSFTNELNNHTTEQMAMVEESTAAITQMIASISSISDLTDNNSNVIKTLESTAVEGDNKLSETTDIIEDINSTVNEINSMSEVIQSISDQTNLLAMNAAIEAAHAGDAGKGFAVVADEIRKLAEASALSSQDISKNLNDITVKFEKATLSGQSTREAFTNINDKIRNVAHALLQVSSSTSELNTGGSQILEAMESLKDISISVQEKSVSMKSKVENVALLTTNVSDISQSVAGAISEANIGFAGVTNSMVGLKDVSDRLGVVSNEINHEVNKFNTK